MILRCPPVLVDRDAFLQVLLNLLKNAAEALAGLQPSRHDRAVDRPIATACRSAQEQAVRASRCRSKSA